MKTKIENEKEFDAAIDQFGKAQDEIEARSAEAKVLKDMIEAYAKESGVNKRKTANYYLRMKKADASLKRMADVPESNVVALLEKNKDTRDFVTKTYNAAAIKSHFKTLDDPADELAKFGLYLTNPKLHAEVKPVDK